MLPIIFNEVEDVAIAQDKEKFLTNSLVNTLFLVKIQNGKLCGGT